MPFNYHGIQTFLFAQMNLPRNGIVIDLVKYSQGVVAGTLGRCFCFPTVRGMLGSTFNSWATLTACSNHEELNTSMLDLNVSSCSLVPLMRLPAEAISILLPKSNIIITHVLSQISFLYVKLR